MPNSSFYDNGKSLRDFVGFGGNCRTTVRPSSVHKLRFNLTQCQTKQAVFGCSECGSTKKLLMNCCIRICPRCEKTRTWKLRNKYKMVLPLFKNPKMLTLTFKGHRSFSKSTKRDMDKKVYYLFRRMRGKYSFGLRVMELKKKEDGLFHIHYHILLESGYISQSIISKEWADVTKDGSFIVDIRKIRAKTGLWYVLKYATKPIDFKIDLEDYYRDFYRTRLITLMGSLYGNLPKFVKEFNCDKCDIPYVYYETCILKDIGQFTDMPLTDFG